MRIINTQKYFSLTELDINAPNLMVVTGLNGSGKSQFLKAIHEGKAQLYTSFELGESVPQPQIKLINQGALMPQNYNSNVNVKEQSSNLFKFFKGARRFHAGFNFSYPERYIEEIKRLSNKDDDQLTEDDFFNYYPTSNLESTDLFSLDFSNLFQRYHSKVLDNQYREFLHKNKGQTNVKYFTKEDIIKTFGKEPCNLINDLFIAANLKLKVTEPDGIHFDDVFNVSLRSSIDDTEINFEDLSSGEKVLMSLALAQFNSNGSAYLPKVLLLDEPDASLHPSMVKQLMDVIINIFVNKQSMNVILTSHSPSTIALAPEESIYVMNPAGSLTRIEKVSKDHALRTLTAGVPSLSVLYENRRQVFVESKNDVVFYDAIYQELKHRLDANISLSFIDSGESKTDKYGQKISNCGQVRNITEILYKAGNKFVSGVIDWDSINKPSEKVHVLGLNVRYSIENYIFDPLFLSALLLREKIIEYPFSGRALKFTDLKEITVTEIQSLINFVLKKVVIGPESLNTSISEYKLINGFNISVPSWYLLHRGHDLEKALLQSFPRLNGLTKGLEGELKKYIINNIIREFPEFIQEDILVLLQSLQK